MNLIIVWVSLLKRKTLLNVLRTFFYYTDYILDDLQQSVSRPGSSLGQPITNYSTHREVQYLNPINTTSISRERSMSPNTSVSEFMSFNNLHL